MDTWKSLKKSKETQVMNHQSVIFNCDNIALIEEELMKKLPDEFEIKIDDEFVIKAEKKYDYWRAKLEIFIHQFAKNFGYKISRKRDFTMCRTTFKFIKQ